MWNMRKRNKNLCALILQFWGSVSCKGSKVLLYLQPDKLYYYCFMDTGRRHRLLGPRQRISLFMAYQAEWASCSYLFPILLKFHASNVEQSRRMVCMQGDGIHAGISSLLRNSKFRKPQFFKIDCKKICPNFFLKGDTILICLDSRQTCPLSCRETLCLTAKAVDHTSILGKIVQNKNF